MSSGQPALVLRPMAAVLTAGATGFAVMAAELTAVRLLAPHFGDSAYVWTNVIGVIMAAMALGAILGGRLSSKPTATSWPSRLLLIAATCLLVAPFVTSWMGGLLLPADLPLDAAMPALIRGSLVATTVVFAPPMLLLAAVSPLLIVLLAKSGCTLGRAAGDIAAAGTIGSLIGTFAATHWLVPGFGCRLALAMAAGVLMLAAWLVAPKSQRGPSAVGLLLAVIVPWLHGGPLRPPPGGIELLAERETAYQFLQVQESGAAGEARRTTLVINEGLDSFHSLGIEGTAFTDGAYYDWHAMAPLLASDGKATHGLRALSIGDAAGTLREVYAAVHPGMEVDAVDIDAETMALGDEFFAGPKAEGARYALDGRVFLGRSKQSWHVIHVDAYAHQVYVPAHLASRQFFEAAYARLHDGGILACNVGALSLQDAVLGAVASTVADVFGSAHAFLIPASRNALLVARRAKAMQPETLASDSTRTDQLSEQDQVHWQKMIATCSEPTNWHGMSALLANSPVLYDDQPLLDELLFASYVEHADAKTLLACAGRRGVEDAEQLAFEALQAGNWQGVKDAVASSSRPTALLRRLAGDACWFRRELHSALLEYQAGLACNPTPELRQTLETRVAGARQQLKPIESAEAAGTRNGWLAVLVTLVGAGLFAGLRRV